MIYLNISLEGCGFKNPESMIARLLGGLNVKLDETEIVDDTLVVTLYADQTPGRLHNLAELFGQSFLTYWNDEDEFGLAIGPQPPLHGFDSRFFVMPGGKTLLSHIQA